MTQQEIRPIRTKNDYKRALKEIEALMDADPGTPSGDRLDVLAILVEDYEEKHFPIGDPDPISAIEHRMEAFGMTGKDIDEIIGAKSRALEVLSGKRSLTINMIRLLHESLKLPAEILIKPSLRPEIPPKTSSKQRRVTVTTFCR